MRQSLSKLKATCLWRRILLRSRSRGIEEQGVYYIFVFVELEDNIAQFQAR